MILYECYCHLIHPSPDTAGPCIPSPLAACLLLESSWSLKDALGDQRFPFFFYSCRLSKINSSLLAHFLSSFSRVRFCSFLHLAMPPWGHVPLTRLSLTKSSSPLPSTHTASPLPISFLIPCLSAAKLPLFPPTALIVQPARGPKPSTAFIQVPSASKAANTSCLPICCGCPFPS